MSTFGIVGLVIVVPLVLFVLGRRRYYRCMTCPLPDGCGPECVCSEINIRHCPVHNDPSGPEEKKP